MRSILSAFLLLFTVSSSLYADSAKDLTGKKVFADEIRAMITDPAATSKVLGYKRNAMPPFIMSEEELKLITAYILSFKDTNKSQELNGTIIKEAYPNVASSKENR